MSNIISFPSERITRTAEENTLPKSRKESKTRIAKVRQEYIDFSFNDIFKDLLDHLGTYGFKIDGTTANQKDMILMGEAVRSYMSRLSGLSHTYHKLADETIVLADNNNDSSDETPEKTSNT